jgi:voltage-gated potassium channel
LRETVNALTSRWYFGPYFLLALMLAIVTLGYPIGQSLFPEYVLRVVITLLLMSAVYAVIHARWVFHLLLLLTAPLIISTWLMEPTQYRALSGLSTAVTMLFFLITAISVFAHIVTRRRITADVIYGSIAIYLLVGIIAALGYQMLNNAYPGSVLEAITGPEVRGGHDNFAKFLYFSLVSLTSVGYGDMAPISPASKSIAMFQGIFGQLYLAILIAKLVGTYTAQSIEEDSQ